MSGCRDLNSVERQFRHFRHQSWSLGPLALGFSIVYKTTPKPVVWSLPCIGWRYGKQTENNMFKISINDTPNERRLIVEGRLMGPWVEELRKSWNQAADSLNGRRLVLDLTNTTVIGPEAEKAIFQLMKEGAAFSCGDVHTKHLLKQLAQQCHARLQDVLTGKRSRE